MHDCLTIPEIIYHIFLFLARADLVSAALTCKDFKFVALRTLWEHLPGLSPVVRCFPADAWRMKKHTRARLFGGMEVIDKFLLTRRLTPQDWNAVLPYLPMIRTIKNEFGFIDKAEISDKILKSIVDSSPGPLAALFPNLRTFCLRDSCTNSAFAFVQALSGSQLESLTFSVTWESSVKARTSLMRSIAISCSNLKTLDLGYKSLYVPAISEAICHCHHLQVVKVPRLSEEALCHVSQLPTLRQLALSDINAPQTDRFPHFPAPSFPALVSLDIRGGHPAFHTSIHGAITSLKYKSYTGLFETTAKAVEWKSLFTQLATMPHGPEAICFDWEEKPQDPGNPDYLITPDIFRPLLSLGANVTTLELDSIFTFDIDDIFVLDLAKACPKVEYFGLGVKWSSGRRSRATLLSFVHLIRHCPKLDGIGLTIDASRLDQGLWDSTKDLENLGNANGEFGLDVGDSYIEDPPSVATFLSTLIDPICEEVNILTADDAPPYIKMRWDTVRQLLPESMYGESDGHGTDGLNEDDEKD